MPTQGAAIEFREAMDMGEVTSAYREFGSSVLRRCRRILRQQHAAEDATQEVFLKLWRYGQSYRTAQSKRGWLYRVAERCCFNELQRRRGLGALSGDADRPEAASTLPEDREVLQRLLGRLDERVQEVAILYFVDELTQDEIAARTGWSRQTIHKKLQLVRDRADAWRLRLLGEAA